MNPYPSLTLRRSDLVSRGACNPWVKLFDEVCSLRGDDRAPLVRKGKISRRDPSRLRITLSPLAQIYLSLPLYEGSTAWGWLRAHNLVGSQNLTGAYLSGANLSWADLTRANLSRANLSGANLSRANLSGAYLSGADLTWADLTGADLTEANLSWANLRGANLSRADLTGADLRGANLTWANLTWANLTWADLTGAYLTGARRNEDDPPVLGWEVRNGLFGSCAYGT